MLSTGTLCTFPRLNTSFLFWELGESFHGKHICLITGDGHKEEQRKEEWALGGRLSSPSLKRLGVIPGQELVVPHADDERPFGRTSDTENTAFTKRTTPIFKAEDFWCVRYLLAVFQSRRRMDLSDTLYICGMTNTHRVQHILVSICRSWKETRTHLVSFIQHPVALHHPVFLDKFSC